ncbi:tetratricopeptide repeat protein [Pseudohongiella spirulinae]|uniref:Uncharacterized protein n=1 Tax=Pseudohongiella spirulinae TaxID=1249552 RepID=A0A0S2KGU7_9GAMM|nr:tetratricopeptide repeat protein [Pseudohongiella spirulinae]ALO47342.1 hypothetical protein PS2015_2710 [Pseudohongiella spirulinae]
MSSEKLTMHLAGAARPWPGLCLAVVLILEAGAAEAQATPWQRDLELAREELGSDPQSSYQRLISWELEAAGDVAYDYWLGVAAVRADQLDQAITALERVIMIRGNHAGARLELAGVYLLQNRLGEAAQQLDIVEQMNPPPAARDAIARYRSALNTRLTSADATTRSAFSMLAVDAGYDSNYLNYPDSFDLFADTPLQGLAILDREATSYSQVRALHFRELRGLSESQRTEWVTSAQARFNIEDQADRFDASTIQSSLTLVTPVSESSEFRLTASLSQLWLDGSQYRRSTSIAAGWQYNLNDRSDIRMRLRLQDNRYQLANNDNVGYLFDTVFNRTINDTWQLRVNGSVESESLDSGAARQGGNSLRQRADIQAHRRVAGSPHQWVFGISHQRLRFSEQDFAAFNQGTAKRRHDSSLTAHAEWRLEPSAQWRFSLRGQHRHQSSNLDFFDIDQSVLQLSAEYLF